jgi:hypothetical protein
MNVNVDGKHFYHCANSKLRLILLFSSSTIEFPPMSDTEQYCISLFAPFCVLRLILYTFLPPFSAAYVFILLFLFVSLIVSLLVSSFFPSFLSYISVVLKMTSI